MNEHVSRKITSYSLMMSMCVVIYHYFMFNGLPLRTPEIVAIPILAAANRFFEAVGTLALGHFFMMSGFLLYYNADEHNIWKKIKRRCYSLGIPFLFWNLTVVIMGIFFERKLPFHDLKGFVKGFTFEPFNGPLWTVASLLFLLIFAPVIVRIRKKRIFAVLFLVILIVCIGISQYHIYPDTWVAFEWLVKTTRYAPLYLLGVYTARFHAQKVLQETYRHKVLGICALLVCVISLIRLSCRSAWGVSEWFLCQVLPVAVWLIPSSRLFQKEIGFPLRISFLIYATHHLMVIPLLNAVYLDFLAERTWTVYGVILLRVPGTLLVYLVTLGIAVFLKSILKPKVFEALSGGRM